MIDLAKGIDFQVGGEVGKFNTLPVDYLVSVAENFQNLIQTLARFHSEIDPHTLDLNNFKLELAGFAKGSAIPRFCLTSRMQETVGGDPRQQRQMVNQELTRLLEVANTGAYYQLKDYYQDPYKRNIVVEDFFNFVQSFGDAPVSVVTLDENGAVVPLMKVRKFKTAIKKDLLTEISENEEQQAVELYGVERIKYTIREGKVKRATIEKYTQRNISVSYVAESIQANGKQYQLRHPLRCLLEKDEDVFVIKSEILDIIGSGSTEEEAEKSFAEEFDFIYSRYNHLDDQSLPPSIRFIKTFLNHMVVGIA